MDIHESIQRAEDERKRQENEIKVGPVKPKRKEFTFYQKNRHKYTPSLLFRSFCIHTFKRDGSVCASKCILCNAFNNQQKEIWTNACHQEDLDRYERDLNKKQAKNHLSVVETKNGNLSLTDTNNIILAQSSSLKTKMIINALSAFSIGFTITILLAIFVRILYYY